MNPDFTHPANERVLAFLKNPYDFYLSENPAEVDRFRAMRARALEKIAASQSPDSVKNPYYGLGTHPEIVARLWDEISVKLPRPCQWVIYNHPVLIHPQSGIVFGWAGGPHVYVLRLPPTERKAALKAGAKTVFPYQTFTLDTAKIGEEWVLGNWNKEEVDWCLSAYKYAEELGQRLG